MDPNLSRTAAKRPTPTTMIGLLALTFLLTGCTNAVLDMMGRQVETMMQTDFVAELPDGLHVLVCGAGGPLPDPNR